jgi:hypothetical protein
MRAHYSPGVPPIAGYGSTITFVEASSEHVVVEIAYDGNGLKPPTHLHPKQEERFEVLEGEIDVLLDASSRRSGGCSRTACSRAIGARRSCRWP